MVISFMTDRDKNELKAFQTKDGKPIYLMLVDGLCFYREYIQSSEAANCSHGTYTYETAIDGIKQNYKCPDGSDANYQYRSEANDKGEHDWTSKSSPIYGYRPSGHEWAGINRYGDRYMACTVCGAEWWSDGHCQERYVSGYRYYSQCTICGATK